MVWPAIVGGISNLVGGVISSIGQSNANDKAADAAANNLAKQEEFARHGITWKVRDVMDAYRETGIHPLAMLGMSGPTYTPVTSAFGNTGEGIGSGLARAGQDVAAAMSRSQDRTLRAEALELQKVQMNNLAESGALDNEIKRLEIASMRARLAQSASPGINFGPNSPTGVGPLVTPDKMKLTVTRPGEPHMEPAANPSLGFVKTETGYMPVRGKEATERLEDDFLGNLMWNIPNRLGPSMGLNLSPPFPAPKGHSWFYHPVKQEYQLIYHNRRGDAVVAIPPSWKRGAGGMR